MGIVGWVVIFKCYAISNVQMCDNLKRRKVKRLRENKKKKENFGIIYNLSIFQNFLKFLFSFLIVICPQIFRYEWNFHLDGKHILSSNCSIRKLIQFNSREFTNIWTSIRWKFSDNSLAKGCKNFFFFSIQGNSPIMETC